MLLYKDLLSHYINRWHIPLLSAILFAGLGLSTAHAAGFQKLESENLQIGIWYPSDTPTSTQRLGPFETEIALNAPVRVGQHEVVLFSHGNGGRFRNHYLTAEALADAGYIVIAPQHQADYLIGGSNTAMALNNRYNELATALQIVRANPNFNNHIVSSSVHGIGYSLGGATIMLAAGAGFSSQRVYDYCRAQEEADPEFCEGPGFISRLLQLFQKEPNLPLPPTTDPFRNPPLITGKAVLVAPVYQGLDIEQPLSMTNLMVITIEGDKIAKPKFHAKPLIEAAKSQIQTDLENVAGHHFAFIAPFPKWLTDKEDIFVAKDPEGFDRTAFLKTVNKIILDELDGS